VASELGCSRAHVYELLIRYRRDRRLTNLLPRRRGPERGRSLLSPEIDRLVHDTIESIYLRRQRPRITELVTEIRKICHDRRLKAPSRKAISARLRKEIVASRRSKGRSRPIRACDRIARGYWAARFGANRSHSKST
jgi:putative transposase